MQMVLLARLLLNFIATLLICVLIFVRFKELVLVLITKLDRVAFTASVLRVERAMVGSHLDLAALQAPIVCQLQRHLLVYSTRTTLVFVLVIRCCTMARLTLMISETLGLLKVLKLTFNEILAGLHALLCHFLPSCDLNARCKGQGFVEVLLLFLFLLMIYSLVLVL